MGLDPARGIGDEQQQEQRDREADAHGQGPYHAASLALAVGDQVKQCGAEAEDNAGEDEDDQDLEWLQRSTPLGRRKSIA